MLHALVVSFDFLLLRLKKWKNVYIIALKVFFSYVRQLVLMFFTDFNVSRFCCLLLNLPWHTFPVQIDENFTLSTQKKWGGVYSVYLYRRASVKVFPAFAMSPNNNKTVIDQWMMYGDCISVSQKHFLLCISCSHFVLLLSLSLVILLSHRVV